MKRRENASTLNDSFFMSFQHISAVPKISLSLFDVEEWKEKV
jgi:hypothetical protein